MIIKFKSRGRSGREWRVEFDFPTYDENVDAAVDYAWKHNARVIEEPSRQELLVFVQRVSESPDDASYGLRSAADELLLKLEDHNPLWTNGESR